MNDTVPDLKALKELAAKATPGPWEVGDPWRIAGINDDGTCFYCERFGSPVWTGKRDINGQKMPAHVHRDPRYPDEHHITSVATFGTIAGQYDWEEGGITSLADAEFIVAACNALPDIIAFIEAQRGPPKAATPSA